MPTTFYEHGVHNAEDFNHNTAFKELMRVTGFLYSLRVLGCTEPGDVIQLDPRLREDYAYLRDHLGALGVATATETIFSDKPTVVSEYSEHDLSVYSYSDHHFQMRPDERRRSATKECDDKNAFILHCQNAGIPVPETVLVDDGILSEAILKKIGFTSPWYVKPARSALGVGISEVSTREELQAAVEKLREKSKGSVPLQIQREVSGDPLFLNTQFRVEEGQAVHVTTSQQILDGPTYIGTRHPADRDSRLIDEVVRPLGQQLADKGLKDCFNLDVAVGDNIEVIECNPRWSASTYPSIVANRLGIYDWQTYTVVSGLREIKELHLPENTIYDPRQKYGAIILNTGLLHAPNAKDRKITFMVTGDTEQQAETITKLQKPLQVQA